jgi:polyisoprenoid-binding protein YceI
MRLPVVALMVLAFAFAPSGAQSVSTDAKQAPTGRYALQGAHSPVLFSIFHAGTTNYYGRFDRVSGSLNYDSGEPEKSSVTIQIDMTSLDTPSATLNTELTGPTVFDATKYPSATFKSTSITRTGPATGKITGDLTIKNITKPVTLDVVFHGGALNPMSNAYAIGFSASTTIKRTDFGITGMRWEPLVGDDVKLVIEALFQHQKD